MHHFSDGYYDNSNTPLGSQALFALKVLKSHGLSHPHLAEVARSTLFNRVLYASPAWVGFITNSDRDRLSALQRKAIRWGLYRDNDTGLQAMMDNADSRLFRNM